MASLVRRHRERAPALLSQFNPLRAASDPAPWDAFGSMLPWDAFSAMPAIDFGRGQRVVPEMEVKETPEAFIVKMDVPGLSEQDIDVSIAGSMLTVSGKREEEAADEGDRFYAYERSYGSFRRSLALPEGCDAEGVKADLKNGVLMISVPKGAGAHSRRISIGSEKAKPPAKAA